MARLFNGTTDLINVDAAHIATESAAWSLAFWLNAAPISSDKYVYSEGRADETNTLFGIHQNSSVSSGKVQIIVRNSAGASQLSYQTTHTQIDSTWHQFIYAQSGANAVAIYTDGGNNETTSYTAAGTFSPTEAAMGCLRRTVNGNFFACSLAHLALFNYQIGDSDAALLGGGLYPNLLATPPTHYWALDGTASPEPDTGTPGGVDGALTGTSQTTGPTMHGLPGPTIDVLNPGPIRGLR